MPKDAPIKAIHPSAATRIKYEKRLTALIDEMAESVRYWLSASYRNNTPATVDLAQDASASTVLQAAFDKLAARWLRRFDELAPKMADWFVGAAKTHVDGAWQTDLRRAGMTVRFKMTAAMRDAFNSVVDENIGLIKSIGSQHFEGVRVALTQAVQNGRDLGYLSDELQKRTGITKRRAVRIARDQANKSTAVMARTRALEMGITEARWVHSRGGKVPRPEHVAFSGQTFDLRTGHDFENGEGIVWPGTAINCRCISQPIIPGFD